MPYPNGLDMPGSFRIRFLRTGLAALAGLALIFVHCTQRRSVNVIPNLLVVGRDSLAYTIQAEGLPAPSQIIPVSNGLKAPLNYSASRHTSWLTLFYRGTTPDTIFAFASSRDLLAGDYVDTIRVSADDAEGSPHDVIVRMTVIRGIKTGPPGINVSVLIGDGEISQMPFVVAPTGGGTMFYRIDEAVPWLSLSRQQGVARDTLMMSFNTQGMAHGKYADSLRVTASEAANSPLIVPCTLSVKIWNTQFQSSSYGLRGIQMFSDSDGIAVGFKRTVLGSDGYVFRTSDGGRTWVTKFLIRQSALVGLKFRDSLRGWVFGEKSAVFVTNNGGVDWLPVYGGPSGTVVDFEEPSTDTLYLVTDNRVVLRSDNNGASWTNFEVPTSTPLTGGEFVDGHSGWVIGDQGRIFRTGDGGATWRQDSTTTISDLRDIVLIDSSTGYAVGDGGTILAMIQGSKWTMQQSPTLLNLTRMFFLNRQTGWIVGDGGMLLRTDDGGRSWQQLSSETPLELFGVWFLDSKHGWIAGDQGLISTTLSGGEDR